MRKIALMILIFALIGCVGLQLPPEAQRVISVNSTTGCEFIKDMYLETPPDITPESLTYSLQWHTYKAGGDSYRIISQVKTTNIIAPFLKTNPTYENKMGETAMTTHFEILKCQP